MMKHIVWIVLSCMTFTEISLYAQQTEAIVQTTGNLTVIVSNLKNNSGKIRIALSDSKENYETKGAEPFRRIVSAITDHSVKVVFEDLPFGEYAVKLIHDENGNGELDMNFLGLIKEDYAFSNNARGMFGPPKYEKAKFEFKEDTIITITLSQEKDSE